MTKSLIAILIPLVLLVVIAAACSKPGANGSTGAPGKVIKTVTVDNLTATLSNGTGYLKQGEQEVTLAFTDSAGKPVDVGSMSLNFHMDQMGTMPVMNNSTTFLTTSTPGVCRGRVNIESAGEWQAQLAFEGQAGKGKTTFTVTAR